jgi:hypothetical protein
MHMLQCIMPVQVSWCLAMPGGRASMHINSRATAITTAPPFACILQAAVQYMPVFQAAFTIPAAAAAAATQQQQQQQLGQQAGVQSAAQLQQQEAQRPVPHILTAAALFGTFFGDFAPHLGNRSSCSSSGTIWPCAGPVAGRQLALQLLQQHLGQQQADLVARITG